MKPVINILEERISAAMAVASGQKDCAAIVRPSTDPKFGDYQVNGVMALAKKIKTNPRTLAQEVVKRLEIDDICEKPEIAGPGFINLRLKPNFVADGLLEINRDAVRLGVDKVTLSKTVVVDFSGPNIAKQMHVGHLRSTIIGDCICRMLEFEGYKVIRQNHIGDWGTQFGRAFLGLWHISMGKKHKDPYCRKELADLRACAKDRDKLLALCKQICDRHATDWRADYKKEIGDGEKVFWPYVQKLLDGEEDIELEEIEVAYQFVSQVDDAIEGMGLFIPTRERDPKTNKWREILIPYEDLSRRVTAMLQKGGKDNEPEQLIWAYITKKTMDECDKQYRRLNVTLDMSHVRGESAYKDDLPDVVAELKKNGLAVESEGAICVFPPGFKDKEGKSLPLIIQKTDGAFLYATTDLAAIRYRTEQLKADRIIYVTDARQSLHFEMVFAVARMAGWDVKQNTEARTQNIEGRREKTEFVHVTFGSVLGEDGKPFKTRSGENVKLKELLDEAVMRARAVVEEKNPELSGGEKENIAKAVGIGAVKYADYSNNRTSDYIFSFNRMLAMEGNTAPYMQYAYARVKSIGRKAQERGIDDQAELRDIKEMNLTEPAELDLARHLIGYGVAIEIAVSDYRPNYLTNYLYELAQKFSVFYANCPVLGAEPAKRPTRLLLCDLTARTIKHGLSELLGIDVVEQM
jgi:arginyl-tRNA synthetase